MPLNGALDAGQHVYAREEKLADRISFGFILAAFVLTGWLHLGIVLLSALFSYLLLSKLNFLKGRGKWPAVVLFLLLLAEAAYGLAYLLQATAGALPGIAEKAVPAVIQWATAHHIHLPFTDLDSLKDQALKLAGTEAKDIGKFANFALGATTEFIYLIVGCVVAIGLFLNPRLEIGRAPGAGHDNMYMLCSEKIRRRFATFYKSFSLVMNAQVTISAIDTTLTAIFVAALGLPFWVVAVGATFICGLLPVVGNLLSNTLVMALGFMVSPAKGLGALAFLVGIHQLEYILNSKIIGKKILTPLWLTFLALVVGESLMGVTGMILAPAVLHYIRTEASSIPVNHKQKTKPRLSGEHQPRRWSHHHSQM